jgi:hypothetical protein
MTDAERQQIQQQRLREFQTLLPMALELAGLPKSEPGRYYSEDQIAARAITLKYAFRVARTTLLEILNQPQS